MILLCFSLVYAIQEGQIITQEQLDNQDIDSYNLQTSFDGIKRVYNTQNHLTKFNFMFSSFSIEPILLENETSEELYHTGQYIFTRPSYYFGVSFIKYLECKQTFGKQNCIQTQLIPYLINKVRTRIQQMKHKIKEYQTKTGDDLTDNDFDFGGEL